MSPVHLSDEEFETAVGNALDSIPDRLAAEMDNVVVLVRDEPEPELLTEADYDADGLPTLLGAGAPRARSWWSRSRSPSSTRSPTTSASTTTASTSSAGSDPPNPAHVSWPEREVE